MGWIGWKPRFCLKRERRIFPLTKKEIPWDQIDTAEVINYGFVGGWGIRYSANYGTVYNTKGKMGVLIKLKKGGKFIIGTQRPEELKSFLDKL